MTGFSRFILLGMLLLAGYEPGYSQDSLWLNNGAVLPGEVKKIALGKLLFKVTDIGDSDIKLEKIKGLRAISHFFRVETIRQETLYGQIHYSGDSGRVFLVNALGDSLSLPLQEIVSLTSFNRQFVQRIDGKVSAGLNYTRSSDIGRFNFDYTLRYYTGKIEISHYANAIMTQTADSLSWERANAGLNMTYGFYKTWYALLVTQYQRNVELGIGRRFQEGVGIANKFLLRHNMEAIAGTGIVINQERSLEGEERFTTEIPVEIRYSLFQFTKPNVQIDIRNSAYFSLTQKGRIRQDGTLNVAWEIISDLSLNLQFYENYDNQPPVASGRRFDYGIVFSIGYSF